MAKAEPPVLSNDVLLQAVAFAARAHRGQIRKDGQTPYASHAFRVCLILRDIFGISDREALAAALLHDTLEDTTTDYDDLAQQFGPRVAQFVVVLTKDSRLPEEERETAYCQGLAGAPWQVKACKLADIYDNLHDSCHLNAQQCSKTQRKARRYLDALAQDMTAETRPAWDLVDRFLSEMKTR
jgi:guanosine-3',5'-bis(diphosphate) 3'-pyrophosphohydrolase